MLAIKDPFFMRTSHGHDVQIALESLNREAIKKLETMVCTNCPGKYIDFRGRRVEACNRTLCQLCFKKEMAKPEASISSSPNHPLHTFEIKYLENLDAICPETGCNQILEIKEIDQHIRKHDTEIFGSIITEHGHEVDVVGLRSDTNRDLIYSLLENLKCIICYQISQNATIHQPDHNLGINHSHSICKPCFNRYKENYCLICHREITTTEDLVPYTAQFREHVEKLTVCCPDEHCETWTKLEAIDKHIKKKHPELLNRNIENPSEQISLANNIENIERDIADIPLLQRRFNPNDIFINNDNLFPQRRHIVLNQEQRIIENHIELRRRHLNRELQDNDNIRIQRIDAHNRENLSTSDKILVAIMLFLIISTLFLPLFDNDNNYQIPNRRIQ